MTVRFLLDTNVISEPLRPKPNQRIIDRLGVHQGECAIASVVWHELNYGMERLPPSIKRATIEQYLARVVKPTIPILDYGEQAARWHAVERARLAALGQTPPFVDGQIAATAAVKDLTLVTANTRDFAHFSGLTLANWFDD